MSFVAGYHAVVLAAGTGSRFGGSKLTARYQGGVLLDAALRTACAAPVESVVVVTGAHKEAVEAAVAAFASGSERPIRTVYCAEHATGMSASLHCGMRSLPENTAGAFIFLGDMPRIPPTVAGELLIPVLAGALAAVPSFNGRWGHPALIARPLFDAFSRTGGDGGGRAVLRRLGADLAVVAIDDEGILTDADTSADLEAITRLGSGGCQAPPPQARPAGPPPPGRSARSSPWENEPGDGLTIVYGGMSGATVLTQYGMNLIDDILEGVRLQSSVFCRMALSGDLGFINEGLDGAPFYLILTGRVWVQIGDGDPFHLGQGDIVILPRGEKHCLLSTPDADPVPFRQVAERIGFPIWTSGMRYKTIELNLGPREPTATLISGIYAFRDPRRNPLLSALPSVLLMRAATDSPAARTFASIAALINEELLSGTPGSESVCARLSDIMFIQVVRHHLAAADTLPRGWLRGMVDAEIAPALATMHRAPDRPWSVATLAREVGMSRSRFAARFHDVVGQAPLEYLTHWRMYQAAGRLAEGPIALPALAASAGYRSEVSFSKAFKRWAGRSPANYRRWYSEQILSGAKPEVQA